MSSLGIVGVGIVAVLCCALGSQSSPPKMLRSLRVISWTADRVVYVPLAVQVVGSSGGRDTTMDAFQIGAGKVLVSGRIKLHATPADLAGLERVAAKDTAAPVGALRIEPTKPDEFALWIFHEEQLVWNRAMAGGHTKAVPVQFEMSMSEPVGEVTLTVVSVAVWRVEAEALQGDIECHWLQVRELVEQTLGRDGRVDERAIDQLVASSVESGAIIIRGREGLGVGDDQIRLLKVLRSVVAERLLNAGAAAPSASGASSVESAGREAPMAGGGDDEADVESVAEAGSGWVTFSLKQASEITEGRECISLRQGRRITEYGTWRGDLVIRVAPPR